MNAIWKQPDGNGGYFVVYHATTAEQVTYSDTTVAAVLANSPLANASDFGKNLLQASNAKAARKIIGVNADPFFDECGNDWTIGGTPYTSGGSLQLDSNNSRLGLKTETFGGEDFAIACKVFLQSSKSSTNQTIFGAGDSNASFIVCTTGSGNLHLYTSAGGTSVINLSTAAATFGQTFHLELDYVNATQTFYLFVDGQKIYEAQDANFATARTFAWFLISYNPVSLDRPMFGSIDEFITKKGATLHTADFTPPTAPYEADSDTVALLHFDGGE